jgi:hypothetical protein
MPNLAPELRQRARELRALADEIADSRITAGLRRAAEACDRFASSEEQHGSGGAGDGRRAGTDRRPRRANRE